MAPRPYVLVMLVRGIEDQKKSAALMADLSRLGLRLVIAVTTRWRRLPPYAGRSSSREQPRVRGSSVGAATALLHRFAYVKQRLAITAAMFLPSTPEWEVKCALALHGWLDAEHAALLYARIAEMREPPPGPWDIPDPRLEAALDEVLAASTTRRPARRAVRRGASRAARRVSAYLEQTNALCDQPSVRVLRLIIFDEEDAAAIRGPATSRLRSGENATRVDWADAHAGLIAAAGGIAGLEDRCEAPIARFRRPYAADMLPRAMRASPACYDAPRRQPTSSTSTTRDGPTNAMPR